MGDRKASDVGFCFSRRQVRGLCKQDSQMGKAVYNTFLLHRLAASAMKFGTLTGFGPWQVLSDFY